MMDDRHRVTITVVALVYDTRPETLAALAQRAAEAVRFESWAVDEVVSSSGTPDGSMLP